MIKKLQIKGLALASLFVGCSLFGQVQLNQLADFGTAIMDINSQGHGIHGYGYYDFATNTSELPESNVGGTNAINDNENVIGLIDDGTGNFVPAMRVGGVWTAFPSSVPLTPDDTLFDVSENGVWVVGQTSWTPENGAWGFIYNTQTEEFRLLSSPDYEYSAAYGVNNDGYAVGWVDDLPVGTLRMAAIFNPDGTITVLSSGNSGEFGGINDNGQAVGTVLGQPVVYDMTTSTLQTFDLPADAWSAAFAGISDTGVAIGYAVYPGFARLPIIYHPVLGAQPLSLIDVLTGFGIDASELNGTGYRISADGNYVAGFTDGPAFMAKGWAVYFDDLLLAESECTLVCPENITVTAEYGETSVVVNYELTYTCDDEEPEGTHIVLVNGLPSGSAFPIGVTIVYHELRDGDDNVISQCSFKVTVKDTYCTTGIEMVEPITHVVFEGIDNTTPANSTLKNEYFLDQFGTVAQGGTYSIAVEGYTGGPYVNYVNVFFDWNQDGVFDPVTEQYNVGALFDSTGTDGQQVTTNIAVPFAAATGLTRMRVIKTYGGNPYDPCGELVYGQTEDYSITVNQGTDPGSDDCSKITLSNGFENALSPVHTNIFANDFVVPAGESFTVNQVKFNFWLPAGNTINTADIYLYEDSAAGPGAEIANQMAVAPSSVKNVGGNYGYIAWEYTFDITPQVLDATMSDPATFWVGVQVAADTESVFYEMTSIVGGAEQYIYDYDESIWVTTTSVFGYPGDGVMSVMGDCEQLGVNDLTSAEFSYYPNPVNDVLNIQSKEQIETASVYGLAGQKLISDKSITNGKLNVASLTSGVYVVQLKFTNGLTKSFKIVKK